MKKGFTLIELIVFVAIFSVSVATLVTVLVLILALQTRQSAAADAAQQSQFLLQQIQYYVQNARLIDMPQDTSGGTLTLRESNPAQDPTTISLANGVAYLQQGSGSSTALTSNRVTISQLSFTRHFNLNGSSSAYGTDSIAYSFIITATGANGVPFTQTVHSSAAVLSPVGKIAMVQQKKIENNNSGVRSMAGQFTTANDSGDLLIAVAVSQGSATTTIADTAGNSWTTIASTSGPSTLQMMVFAATNAAASVNTTTVTYAADVGYPSLYLYEYRGAASTSSFDASSTQLQAATKTPSSGLATPTSTVELLFGVNYGLNLVEVPAASSSFILETSSTANNQTQVFVEDAVRYITGQVAAIWQYTNTTPSTTAFIATFK